jgi:L-threonylcarbamoyladenylate synthase
MGKSVGAMVTRETARIVRADIVKVMGDSSDLFTIAAGLFSVLRAFDGTKVDVIFAEGVPEKGIGLAVMNRLRKAAGYNVIQASE